MSETVDVYVRVAVNWFLQDGHLTVMSRTMDSDVGDTVGWDSDRR